MTLRNPALNEVVFDYGDFGDLTAERSAGGNGIIDDTKKLVSEATETIKAVYAQYGYKPEHSFLCVQVGAVIASISNIRQVQLNVKEEKSRLFVENTKNAKTVYDKAINKKKDPQAGSSSHPIRGSDHCVFHGVFL